MAIRVYNSLTRSKEEFVPQSGKKVGIYVCGVTPYSETHLGHARPSVVWDVIKKFLEWYGFEVFHVQNFTDVDDKIIARSQAVGCSALELSAKYADDYLESMDALGVRRADLYPRVSEHIDDIIKMIEQLVKKGHAYAVNGNVFFDVDSFPNYGQLSNQRAGDLLAGTRFEVDENKKNPADFALWKAAKPQEPAWPSPWGEGRPGWHIECSVMSNKYLGSCFDFHGGGVDLVFPHHENEIAQSQAATGQPPARYWLHNGMLTLKTEKMSKSTGNYITIKQVVSEYPRELVRFFILSCHYRSELEYYQERMEEARRGWQKLVQCWQNLRKALSASEPAEAGPSEVHTSFRQQVTATKENIVAAMEDDFNTALAIAQLFDLQKAVNSYLAQPVTLDSTALQEAVKLFEEFGRDVLGILPGEEYQTVEILDPLMDLLLEVRQELRREKNFQLADLIRDRLADIGVVVEDTAHGARWKLK